jgi:type II secretory ATPase GspE/PulE/Tfp pilus assembly ATPase PilB-like protein
VLIAECVRFDIGEIGEVVMQCLGSGESATSISRSAIAAGMVPLAGAAWRLVDRGITDEAEVYRVLGSAAKLA